MNTSGKIKITWSSDSSGVASCHLNDGKMTRAESYVGHVFLKGNEWWSKHKDGTEHGPHRSMMGARLDVERSVNGEPV